MFFRNVFKRGSRVPPLIGAAVLLRLCLNHSGLVGLLILLCGSTSVYCEEAAAPDAAAIRKLWAPKFTPIPKVAVAPNASAAVIDLGRRLFYERALSPERNRSCNDCHDLSKHGANGDAAVAARAAGLLKRDVPSVYNVAELQMFRWDGGHVELRAQTAAALTSANECGLADAAAVVDSLKPLAGYDAWFKAAFGNDSGGVSFQGVVDALTAFQQGLVTRAPIDDFVLGDDQALSAEQLQGALLFEQKNCSSCHTGTAIGGQMIQIAGIMMPWPNQKDLGHFEVSGNAAHKLGFRVPPLRNVAATAPYFHDYSAKSLRKAIRDISLYEQGIQLEIEEIVLLEEFLKSFTGALPLEYIKPPVAE